MIGGISQNSHMTDKVLHKMYFFLLELYQNNPADPNLSVFVCFSLGRSVSGSVTPQEEEEFRHLASMPNIYDMVAKSIAPSIYGSNDIKKAIACMLFGGSRKR